MSGVAVLGVDPGVNGGAAWLDEDGGLYAAVGWTERKGTKKDPDRHGWEVHVELNVGVGWFSNRGGLVSRLELVAQEIGLVSQQTDRRGWVTYTEELRVFPGKGNSSAIIRTAEAGAIVWGGCLATGEAWPERVAPVLWRHEILGLKRGTHAAECERAAVHFVQHFDWCGGVDIGAFGVAKGHVAEAICIARYGHLIESGKKKRPAA